VLVSALQNSAQALVHQLKQGKRAYKNALTQKNEHRQMLRRD
jgi:hypothetical protein